MSRDERTTRTIKGSESHGRDPGTNGLNIEIGLINRV